MNKYSILLLTLITNYALANGNSDSTSVTITSIGQAQAIHASPGANPNASIHYGIPTPPPPQVIYITQPGPPGPQGPQGPQGPAGSSGTGRNAFLQPLKGLVASCYIGNYPAAYFEAHVDANAITYVRIRYAYGGSTGWIPGTYYENGSNENYKSVEWTPHGVLGRANYGDGDGISSTQCVGYWP